MSGDLPMFTAEHRDTMLHAQKSLAKMIKSTQGGLAALGAASSDVNRIALESEQLKMHLNEQVGRERWNLDPTLKNVTAQAIGLHIGKLEKLREAQLDIGIAEPSDTDQMIDSAKQIGRSIAPARFPQDDEQTEIGEED